MFLKQQNLLPHVQGYNAFSMIQWLACIIGLIHAFGWLWGFAAFIGVFTVLQFIAHFTLGLLWSAVFKKMPAAGLAAFSIMVWITLFLSIAHVIWGDRHI